MHYFNMSEFLRTFIIHYPYSFKKQINTYDFKRNEVYCNANNMYMYIYITGSLFVI